MIDNVRGTTGTSRSLAVALGIHVVAAAVFAAMVLSDVEGCDAGDGAALAVVAAVVVDTVLSVTVASVMLMVNRSQRRAVLTGFLVGLAPAVTAFVVAVVYVQSLGTGCPV